MKEYTERFRLIRHTWGGHKWFEDLETGRIALCDDSGETPDEADDGIIWLDTRSRIIVIVSDDGPVDECGVPKNYEPPFVRIPIFTQDGDRQNISSDSIGGNIEEWMWAASEFGLEVEMLYASGRPGYLFRVSGHRTQSRKSIFK